MNLSQNIFLVFFAIFWGISANAWPRWKAFHWTFIDMPPVRRRVAWSFLMLNVIPVALFTGTLMLLERYRSDKTTFPGIIAGIIPAFEIFGIYRVWIAIIESHPTWFYFEENDLSKPKPDPSIECLGLSSERWHINFVIGALYVILPLAVAWFMGRLS